MSLLSNQVGDAVQITAHGQKDDGPLGVRETLRVQEEGQDRQRGGEEAEHGPHRHPRVSEDFGSSSVEAAVIAALEDTALSLFEPHILVRCRLQRLTLLVRGRRADRRVGGVFITRTLHTHVVVVILRWEAATVEHLKGETRSHLVPPFLTEIPQHFSVETDLDQLLAAFKLSSAFQTKMRTR